MEGCSCFLMGCRSTACFSGECGQELERLPDMGLGTQTFAEYSLRSSLAEPQEMRFLHWRCAGQV